MTVETRPPTTLAFPWTRLRALAMPVAFLAAAVWATSAGASPVPAEGGRWAAVGPVAGYRTFPRATELDGEFAIGARVTLGLSDRVAMMIDGAHSDPTRRTSGVTSSFGDIRALVAYRVRDHGVQPYLLTGIGGQILNFHDAPASASAVVAAGLGLAFDLSPEWVFTAEGSADFYRGRFVTYSPTGQELSSTKRETYATGLYSAGIQYRF